MNTSGFNPLPKIIHHSKLFSMPNFKTGLPLVLAFILCVNLNAQTYNGKTKDINQILENIAAFSQAFMDGDAEKMVNSYTTDGKIFPNNKDILEGKKDLFAHWNLPDDIKILHHKITPSEITIIKKTAYDYGYYEGETLLPDGEKSTWRGKYVIIWKKVGKEWKMYLDIWNGVK